MPMMPSEKCVCEKSPHGSGYNLCLQNYSSLISSALLSSSQSVSMLKRKKRKRSSVLRAKQRLFNFLIKAERGKKTEEKTNQVNAIKVDTFLH